VVEVIVVEKFWESVEEVTSVCEPIISLLRLVDGTVPSVGKVYWKMFQIDNGIEQSATLNQVKKTQLKTSINERWKMLYTELHSVGFVLDPKYRTFLQHKNEVMADFHAIVERVFEGNVQAQVKVIQQHTTYRAGHKLFSRPMAEAAAKEMPAFRWWRTFLSFRKSLFAHCLK